MNDFFSSTSVAFSGFGCERDRLIVFRVQFLSLPHLGLVVADGVVDTLISIAVWVLLLLRISPIEIIHIGIESVTGGDCE